jgi:SAM-dependent methyltransferase
MPLFDEDLAYVQAIAFSDMTAAAMPAVLEYLDRQQLAGGRVLDVGCGAGLSTAALASGGYRPEAIDVSTHLLAFARSAAPTAEFHCGSVYEFDFPRCAAILALSEPLTYHRPDVVADLRLAQFFGKAADALPPGGALVFDVISADGPALDAKGWKSGQDWAILWETTENRQEGRLIRSIETFRNCKDGYRRAHETHHVKLFSETQIRSWLSAAGFDATMATAYGARPLLPRRLAFFASRR